MSSVFYANGKLLLTAEYFVLDGATALALPVKYGQSLTVTDNAPDGNLHWKSFDHENECWFEAIIDPGNFDLIKHNDAAIAKRLQSIFRTLKKHNPAICAERKILKTDLSFPRDWGLGTSSTLIYLLAKWAGVDPFELQFDIFGGSGYDIACAGADGPILYKKENGLASFERCEFRPPFADQLFFVFLEQKQNSREGIERFKAQRAKREIGDDLIKITDLTHSFLETIDLTDFEKLIGEHEQVVGKYLNLSRAKSLFFSDFWGEIKSLGAWGGDFIMVTSQRSEEETRSYFNEKGFDVFIPYREMVL